MANNTNQEVATQLPSTQETATMITVNDAARKSTILDTSKWSPEFVNYMLAYAHGVRMQRCTASVDPANYLETRQAMFDSMAKGEVPTSGGGGGSKLSVQDAAWIAYFKSKGSPVKFKGETPNGKNLEKYQLAFTRKAIWPSIRDHLATLDETAQRDFRATKLTPLIASNKDLVIKKAEEADLKPFIKAEQLKREGKKPEQASFSIEIQIG